MSEEKHNRERANAEVSDRLAAGLEKLQVRQTRDLVINVDDAWEEEQARSHPIEINFGGKVHHVSPSMPARFYVFYTRHLLQPLADGFLFIVPDDKWDETLELALGQELAQQLLTSDLDLKTINRRVLRPVLEKWGLPFADDEPQDVELEEKKTERTHAS